ncbi:cell surface protein [uncultured Brachyspira sp.]|uniref:cell surface protein n=1 Tax=uncultured Brachyspira sp. TaxID=221953 RepID=UPI0025D23083|nr:cell surface protein [uncultured Brachyspira sp.]
MKKIIFIMMLVLTSSAFAIDDRVDKDNMHNLIEGVTYTRFGSDRVGTIYDFAPLMNHNTSFKLGVSILDLSHIVDNTYINEVTKKRRLAFLPKGFVGLSYGIFGFGYQFGLYNDLSEKNSPIAHSHSFSFGLAMDKYRLSLPFSFSFGDKSYHGGHLSLSTTPKFSFMFRSGLLDEFTISLHYGIQLSSVTNSVGGINIAPMVVGGSLYGNIMLTRFDNFPVQIGLPVKLAFYYGIGARWATIDAGYAEDININYLYGDNGERATDSMYFYVILPAKFEAKLGAIYTYIMPRLMFEGELYKTDIEYNLHYGIEGEMQITLIENLTFGLTAYAEGQGIMKKSADFQINNAFGGGLDVWGIWRY